MVNYIYDGSFEGLLCCIYEAFYRHEVPGKIISRELSQQNFLDVNIRIKTEKEKYIRVYNSIRERISETALDNVFFVFLSECQDSGILIYNYLKLGWKIGADVDRYLSDDRVLKVNEVRRKVSFEMHRMLGLVRFRQSRENVYYASITPDHNIIQLIAPHFARRMSDQNWVIHDIKRSLAAVYNKNDWFLTDLKLEKIPLTDDELFYQELWKQYFKNISIPSRYNPELQKRNMPSRYWRNLVEK